MNQKKLPPKAHHKGPPEEDSEEFEAKPHSLGEDEHSGGGHGGTEMGWLVSYADMMTLLFGLFVLLYVLKSDKTRDADETMRQISNQFFSSQAPPQPTPKEPIPNEPVPTPAPATPVETNNKESESQIEKISEEKNKLEAQVTEQKAQYEGQIEELNKKIAGLESKNVKKNRQAANSEAEAIETLKKEVESIKAQNAELKEQLQASMAAQQSYLTTLITWDTEKHDLDLEIISEKNKVFSFKKRKVSGVPGAFEIDSRYGPGIEMWKAENYKPGQYRARIVLFNKNGNSEPAKVKLSIFSQLEIFKSEVFEISEVGVPLVIKFNIDEKGKIQVLP